MKLKAFTLVETVVIIAITGILVFFCVFTYLILKTHEKNFTRKNSSTEEIVMASSKISEMFYRANSIRWQTPYIVFEGIDVLGKVEVEDDSIAILNRQGYVFVKVGAKGFEYVPVNMKGGEVFIQKMEIKMDQVKYPLKFEKKNGADVKLNASIDWDN